MERMHFEIDLSGVDTYGEFHTRVKNALELPEYYGENLDALYDVLTELGEQWSITFYNTREMEEALSFRDRLLSGQGCSFSASVTADYGDTLQEFSLECEADPLGNVEFTVSAPETVAGITGTMSETGGKLTFDETALQFDLLAEDTLSPVSAPWLLIKTLRSGCITSVGKEEEMLRLSIDDSYRDDALRLDIWLDGDRNPVRAEVLDEGVRILTVSVRDFQIL